MNPSASSSTYSMNALRSELNCSENHCRVCGAVSDGVHFGIVACRACSAFFRRSVVEERVYKCLYGRKCGMALNIRNSCRSCRFARCQAAGMKTEKVQHPRDRNRRNPQANQKPNKVLPSTPLPTTSKILDRLREGYKQYHIAHRAIFSTMHPKHIFADRNSLATISIDERFKLDMAVLPSIYIMFKEYFCPYALMDKENKFEVIITFLQRFLQLERSYLTALYFPDKDNVVAFSQLDYADFDHMNKYFKNDVNPKESERTFRPYLSRLKRLTRKAKMLQLDEMEFLGLVGILTASEIYWRTDAPEAFAEQTQMFKELHQHCQKKSHTSADTRFGQLLMMIRDGEEMSWTFNECIFLGVLVDDIYKATVDRIRDMIDMIQS
ncbi:unnamed protein product [Bursaphelenchus xylophilus]|uniref:(pine wood nematode) hypothetical protein n=1 Tax=Bursaphelenchus xylophilus TaxID=6326 RepID=A0A1I7SFS6_BURXY|nr:unnamed protein product [Bursaphelenchus xylophilus]CAG9114352.1 unnamed protein product [Bursaphelenchus xylophilus]